jgi:hypothetical protein
MKSKIFAIALCCSMFLLTGCPVSSTFPLGQKGDVEFNDLLIGTWSTEASDPVVKKATISKGEEAETAFLHVDERGEMFMADGDDFLIWLTILENKTFLVMQQIMDGENQPTFYAQHITIAKDLITTSDFLLLVNGTDAITSIEAYREEVKASMDNSGFLMEQIEWNKN